MLGSPARLQAPSQRLAVATTFFRAVDGAWSGWAKGLAFPLPFWRWWNTQRGGGGRTRSVLKSAGPGALGPGPRSFVWQAVGRPWGPPLGRQPPPPPARPPRPFRFPRATAVGPAEVRWGTGRGLPLGYAGGDGVLRARRARKTKAGAGAKGPRPCFVRAVRARRPPGAMGFSTGQTIHPPTLSAPASNKET